MRRKDERSKQDQTNNKVKQHRTPKVVTFPKKNELPRVGLEPMYIHVHAPVWESTRKEVTETVTQIIVW